MKLLRHKSQRRKRLLDDNYETCYFSKNRAKTTFEPQPPPATGTEATPTKKVLSAITNKHSTILLILTAAILVTATLSIIFALNPSHRPREDGQSVTSKPPTDHPNFVGEHRIYTKSEWGGRAHTKPLRPLDLPAEYVLISHTAGQFCENFNECAPKVQFIQSLHVSKGSPDIGYNFLIGGDGSVYTGRGWDFTNFHNAKSVGVSLLGNYVYDSLNEEMLDALQSLLERGVALGKLPVDYKLVCHNQTTSTLSPGDNAYKEIAKFSHFYKGPVVI